MVMSRKVYIYPLYLFTSGCHTPLATNHSSYVKQQLAYNENYSEKDSRYKGFTLVELIVTLAIIAIIVTIATPFMLRQLATMEAKRIRYALSNTLKVAKAESLIRRKNLILCLSDDNSRCNRNSNEVLLLFIDNNRNNHFDPGTDQLLEQHHLSPKYATIHLRVGSRRHYTKFWGDSGKPRGHFGHIKYCPTSVHNNVKYQISFNQAGIIKYKPNSSHRTNCD
ncbi:prepilin-type N-terminal cleavage/methylation domain-containing protein [Psychrobacter sp. TAE2020]|uniref:prepilin-type N-terminal cleavage/methylation domain-containing protein n=1 Tax=Psychrobacter sp. TAE2020 TaxID=2846762 RepID=UPI001E4CF806|nr:prepilin-type N-terminal cleavage/methylation domain-containing protein [Psychrobacter sp. TAE2020]